MTQHGTVLLAVLVAARLWLFKTVFSSNNLLGQSRVPNQQYCERQMTSRGVPKTFWSTAQGKKKKSHKKTVHCSTSTTLVPASAGNTPTKFNNTSKTSCGCLRDGRMQWQLVQPSSALTNTKQWHVLQGLFAMWHRHYSQQEITVWTPYFDLAW